MLFEGLPSYLPGYHVNTNSMPGFRLAGISLYSNIAGRFWHLNSQFQYRLQWGVSKMPICQKEKTYIVHHLLMNNHNSWNTSLGKVYLTPFLNLFRVGYSPYQLLQVNCPTTVAQTCQPYLQATLPNHLDNRIVLEGPQHNHKWDVVSVISSMFHVWSIYLYLAVFLCKLGASGIEFANLHMLHMAISTAGSQSLMGCSFFWNNWTPTSLPKTKARTKIKRWKGSVLFLAGLYSTTTTEVRFVPFSMANWTGDWGNLMRSGVVWICVGQSLIPQYVFNILIFNLKLPGVDLRANFRHVPIKYIFLQQVHCSSFHRLRECLTFQPLRR